MNTEQSKPTMDSLKYTPHGAASPGAHQNDYVDNTPSTFRKVSSGEADQLFAVYSKAFSEMRERLTLWSKEQLEIEVSAGHAWALYQQDQIAAFLIVNELGNEIDCVGVAPQLRRRGLAAKLISEWVALDPEKSPIFLEVHEHEDGAIALYNSLGFSEISRRAHYYPDGGTAVVMALETYKKN